ncbi:MAG: STAS domain-containing protein [candidate division Zixibacteria bacterium]|jgi:anti-sigma B factor antagonist|nr:STAS domain-containing protein [candidate division Zixibacteria bacterium]
MKFTADLTSDVVTLSLSGKILGEPRESAMFHGTIHEFLALNKRNFIVDLEKVERINSIGLGMLIAGYTSVTRAEGRFVLCNFTNVESILTVTRVLRVFEHCESLAEAQWLFSDHNQKVS